MSASRRLAEGGRIDRARPLAFTFDGTSYEGCAGDTLASALLANGVDVVGTSVTQGRPRGIYAAGAEEPNAFVQLTAGACSEPMLRATGIELYDGLSANSLAGRGRLSPEADPALYDKMHVHCDVLVVGGGPAGLAAVLAAGRTGARVLLVDEGPELGGSLLGVRDRIDGAPAARWVATTAERLAGMPEVRVLSRTTAVGYFDHNYVVLAERRTDHLGPATPQGVSRQRLWHVRAGHVVLATGAHERPLVFADNDRPGVMLAGAVRTYLNRYAVPSGRTAVVFTTNDSAYAAAIEMADAGVAVAGLVDARPGSGGAWAERARSRGIELLAGQAVVGTTGGRRLEAVDVMALTDDGEPAGGPRTIPCDLLAVSGGWNPVAHLFSQSRGALRYDEELTCFVPDRALQAQRSAGACRGAFGLAACLADGLLAGGEAAASVGYDGGAPAPTPVVDELTEQPPCELWAVPPADSGDGAWRTHFVDLHRDATVADLRRAVGAGMRSPEHVKRYTTIGTGDRSGQDLGPQLPRRPGRAAGDPPPRSRARRPSGRRTPRFPSASWPGANGAASMTRRG